MGVVKLFSRASWVLKPFSEIKSHAPGTYYLLVTAVNKLKTL